MVHHEFMPGNRNLRNLLRVIYALSGVVTVLVAVAALVLVVANAMQGQFNPLYALGMVVVWFFAVRSVMTIPAVLVASADITRGAEGLSIALFGDRTYSLTWADLTSATLEPLDPPMTGFAPPKPGDASVLVHVPALPRVFNHAARYFGTRGVPAFLVTSRHAEFESLLTAVQAQAGPGAG